MARFDDDDIIWRTIGGRRIPIRKGQSLSEAMKESGKFKLSKKQKEEGERLNKKAENGVREDIKAFLSGKENYEGSKEDFINDLSNEWNVDKSKVEEILHEENIKHSRLFKEGKSIEANKPAGQKMVDLINDNNVRTFADEIKEQTSPDIKVKGDSNIIPRDFKKGYGRFKIETTANNEHLDDLFEITKDEYGEYHAKNLRTGETYATFGSHLRNNNVFEFQNKNESDFYKKLNKEDKTKYNNYLKKGYSKSDIENTLMYETQEDRMRNAGIKFGTNEKMNPIVDEIKYQNKYDNMSNYEIYDKADALARETKDYELRSEINKKLDRIDRANKKGEGYAEKPTNELRKILANNEIKNQEQYNGYEAYLKDTQGTTNEELINVGREKENRVDYQKYKNEVIRNINNKRMEKGTTSLEQAYKKAFEEYKRLHPNSKLSLSEFIRMSEE